MVVCGGGFNKVGICLIVVNSLYSVVYCLQDLIGYGCILWM